MMAKASSTGEMPFLEHLEELRSRLIRVILAVILGTGVGIWAVTRFHIIEVLKGPIAPYLPDGRLTVLSPTEPVMALLKLGFIVGLVLASPIIIWQIWAFLSPALYEKERKAIVPSLFVGLVLFLAGATVAFTALVPKAIGVLLSIQAESFAPMITYDKYFGLVIQLMLGMGVSFELPLIIIVLSALGVVSPRMLRGFRRYWVVVACILGAVLSPGPDVFSMMLMTIPLLFLYEIGVLGSTIIARRRERRDAAERRDAGSSAALLFLAAGLAGVLATARPMLAQQPPPPPQPPPGRQLGDSLRDSTRLRRDSLAALRMGLPTSPSKAFAPPDSVVRALMELQGYVVTRFRSDSAFLQSAEKNIELHGNAMTERAGVTMEAEDISYRDRTCAFQASGAPKLFQQGTVAIGDTVRFNTCTERGVLDDGLTTFQEVGANWFIRGNLAVDSTNARLYAAAKEITSCDLPESHYHFAAREVKWISQSTMVARPAVLYIRDVPVLWLPFLFQDTKRGRRSGILIPQFGINDIVRPTRDFKRQVTNVGFYWAASDYFDLGVRLDWLADRSTTIDVSGQYRWLDRFLDGNIGYRRQMESGTGNTNTEIRWNHNQSFGAATRLRVNLSLVSNTRVINNNAIDPLQNTASIVSNGTLDRAFSWGRASLGFTRSQSVSDGSSATRLPSLTISPKSIDFGSAVTWSPTLSMVNNLTARDRDLPVAIVVPGVDTATFHETSRNTTINIGSDLRIGSFNLPLKVDMSDRQSTERRVEEVRIPNLDTPEEDDSITVSQVAIGDFESTVNWTTSIALPVLFRGSWKVTPSVGLANAVPGQAFRLRNRRSNGEWVQQAKRLSFSLSAAPTIFGFLPGFGSIDRIRHSISPTITYSLSPEQRINDAFAQAIAARGQVVDPIRPRSQTLQIGLSQSFEAKERPAPGDSAGRNARKFRLLSLRTSSIAYDFEQAKLDGRTGWATQSITNQANSDLLPGFDLSVTHNLWRGTVGSDTAKFEPFMESVNASFNLTGRTFQSLAAFLGLAKEPAPERPVARNPAAGVLPDAGRQFQSPLITSRGIGRTPLGPGFQAALNISISRTRPPGEGDTETVRTPTRSSVGFRTSFQPTAFWSLSWDTQYNVTDKKFEYHSFQLQRDLHDWRASFNFARNTNGNFAFFFSVNLMDLPDLKFDYNQTTVQR